MFLHVKACKTTSLQRYMTNLCFCYKLTASSWGLYVIVGDAWQGWSGYIACLLCHGWFSLQQIKNKDINDCISKLSLTSVACKVDQLWAIPSSSAMQSYCYTVDVQKVLAQTSSSNWSNNNSVIKEHVWSWLKRTKIKVWTQDPGITLSQGLS